MKSDQIVGSLCKTSYICIEVFFSKKRIKAVERRREDHKISKLAQNHDNAVSFYFNDSVTSKVKKRCKTITLNFQVLWLKPHLHDLKDRHGTPKFRHRDQAMALLIYTSQNRGFFNKWARHLFYIGTPNTH